MIFITRRKQQTSPAANSEHHPPQSANRELKTDPGLY